MEKQRKNKVYFDKALLDKILIRDGATISDEYTYLNRDTIINFKCKCGKNGSRRFRNVYENAGLYCIDCKKINTDKKVKDTFHNIYGCSHPLLLEEYREKQKNTVLGKYNVENISQLSSIKLKKEETCSKNFGVKHPSQSDIIKEKIKDTCLKNNGVIYPMQSKEIQDKSKKTLEKNFGVSTPLQSNVILDKAKKTMTERFGYEHANQNPEIFEKAMKNAKKYKDYKMPSGEIRKLQGYESFALDELLKSYTEDQIKTDRKDVGRIQYKDNSGKIRYYFPDIFIPHENRFIEVKSIFTASIDTDIIKAKRDACINQGYSCDIWKFDKTGKRIN